MEPLVTVIITTYQREKDILKRAIDSVLGQTYSNIELIVVDDNGVDSAFHEMIVNLLNEYNKVKTKVQLIAPEKNQGVQKARNSGIDTSNGEYIAFLDDDDEWSPEKITKQMELFKRSKSSNLALVHCWYTYVISKGKRGIKKKVRKPVTYTNENKLQKLLRGNYIGSTSFPLLRKSAVIDVGKFDENLSASQDYDLWLRLVEKYEIACVEESLGYYYVHSGERISSTLEKKEQAVRYLNKKYEHLFKKDSQAYSNKLFNLGKNLLEQGKLDEGRKYVLKSIRNYPLMRKKIYPLFVMLKSYLP